MTLSAAVAWKQPESADEYVKWDAIPPTERDSGAFDTGSHPVLTKTMRVSRRRDVMGGLYVIAGTRLPIFWVFDMFVTTHSVEEVQRQYPHVSADDIFAAVAFAMQNQDIVNADREEHSRAISQSEEA